MTKQNISKYFLMLWGLLFAGGLIWLLVLGMKLIWTTLSSVNPSLAVGIIAAGSTVFVSLATVLISKRLEQIAMIKNQQREKKIPIYEELIAFLFRMTRASNDNKNMPTQEEIIDFMFGFIQKLLIWGSDDVVIAFEKFRRSSQGQGNILFAVEDIWAAIRKDLGHSNKGISKGTLLSLIINDIDDFMKKT